MDDVRPRFRTLVPARWTFVQESGRSTRKEDARPGGRSSEDARPSQKRTLVHAEETRGRSSMQKKREDARPCRRNERTLVHAEETRGRSSMQKKREDARPCRRGRSSMQEDVRPAERSSRGEDGALQLAPVLVQSPLQRPWKKGAPANFFPDSGRCSYEDCSLKSIMKTLSLKEIIGHKETTRLSITSCPKFFLP
ncbi:hypothetical protein LR48_Vigan10g271300 [Vigna angularis]|uniref:Uncharacterized protein n=1 Tax=Phaseolus angularis TaxID=3914 RepID=A0A0L9VP22_PHAAN|nr:hypothetical protein LR48_Vigan10g271300 [Vigna angularis]